MTEIVAAHLERVAREVASKIAHEHYGNVGCSSALCRNCEYGDPNGFLCHVCELQELAEPWLAAALAACAREERLDEARWWQHSIGVDHTGDYADTLEQRARIAALERAVGESSLDPQGGQHDT